MRPYRRPPFYESRGFLVAMILVLAVTIVLMIGLIALQNESRSTAERRIGDLENTLTEALNNIGGVYESQGQYDLALESYQQALAFAREVGDRAGEGATSNNIGGVYNSRRQADQALEYYQQALVIAREVGDRAGEATRLNNIGLAYASGGQTDQALENYGEALVIARDIGAIELERAILSNIERVRSAK